MLAERHTKTVAEKVVSISAQAIEAVRGDLGTAYEKVHMPLHELPESEIKELVRMSLAEEVAACQMLSVPAAVETLPPK